MVSINGKPLALHDADDWLFEFVPGFAEWHNMKFGLKNALGVQLEKKHFKEWDLTKTIGGTKEEINKKLKRFYCADSFLKLIPNQESQELIEELADHYHQGVCTSRPEYTKESTHFQFQMHYYETIPLEMIKFTNFKPKDEVILSLRPKFFVDDCFENHDKLLKNPKVLELVKSGDLRLFMNNQPWNKDLSKPMVDKYVTRIAKPKDLLGYVL